MENYNKRSCCASCGGTNLIEIMNYGTVTLAGFFPKEPVVPDNMRFPLSLFLCDKCYLVQTDSTISPTLLFKDYRYLSSIGLSQHFEEFAKKISDQFPDRNSKILEIGSNDGALLKPLMDLGYSPIGFEPSDNISKVALSKECNVINDFFNRRSTESLPDKGSYDLILASNCLAHIPDINEVVSIISECLKDGGSLIMEVHYGKNIFDQNQFDNVYHEHIYYYTLLSLEPLFSKHGMNIYDVEDLSVHAGSIRVHLKKGEQVKTERARSKMIKEVNDGLTVPHYYAKYENSVIQCKNRLHRMFNDNQQNRIIGYGASGRANVLCDIMSLDNSIIHHIIDESPERIGRHIGNIPIVHPDNAINDGDIVIIFAWNYAKTIMKKLEGRYVRFIIPLPEPMMVGNVSEIASLNSL